MRIKDVAVFDWNCLFIVDFHGLNEASKGIWYKEEKKEHATSDTFHTMLLGFLLRAMARYPHMR